VEACETVLTDAISNDVIEGIRQLYNKEPIFEIVQLNCALAAIRLEEARLLRDPTLFDKAQQHVEAAKAVRSGEMLPDMMQGLLELSKVRGCGGSCVCQLLAIEKLWGTERCCEQRQQGYSSNDDSRACERA
jgi:hypothetical protein